MVGSHPRGLRRRGLGGGTFLMNICVGTAVKEPDLQVYVLCEERERARGRKGGGREEEGGREGGRWGGGGRARERV